MIAFQVSDGLAKKAIADHVHAVSGPGIEHAVLSQTPEVFAATATKLPGTSIVRDVPRSLGPFLTPERKRTFSPDDVALFRLLCGLKGLTPGKMFARLVKDEARRILGAGAAAPDLSAARQKAETLFAKTGRRTPVYSKPGRGDQS